MSEMIDKVFSTKLGEQMTGFYGKQKMLRRLNNKLEMNNQQQKVVELDQLIGSYADKVALSEDGLYDDCEEYGDCPLMGDEHVLSRMEEVLAEAYMAQDEQGSFDPWSGTRDFLEFGEAREDAYLDQYDQEQLQRELEDELKYKERELALAKRTAERERKKRQLAEEGHYDIYTEEEQQYNEAVVRPPQHQQTHQQQHLQQPQPRIHQPVQSQIPQQQPIQQQQQHYSQDQRYQVPEQQHQQQQQTHHFQPRPTEPQYHQPEQLHRALEPLVQQHMQPQYQQQQQFYQPPQPQQHQPQQHHQQSHQQPQLQHQQPFFHAEVVHEQEPQHHYQQHQHQPSHQYDYSQPQHHSGRYDRYAESLREKNWDELREERELRHARERNLFTRKSDAQNPAANGALASVQDSYGPWTDPTAPAFYQPKKQKKQGALRWLDPDWSIVRWFKHTVLDQDEDEHYHDSSGHRFHMNGVAAELGGDVMPPEIANEKQPAHAIVISSIFSSLVTLFGLYLCMKIMLPSNRFERNSNLTVFYLAAFSFLIISLIPLDSGSDSEVVFKFHKKWDHHPESIVGVCTEIFRLAVILFHLSSITNLFLLNLERKFRTMDQVQKWTNFLREFNIVATFVCLAFLIPLRQDFDWALTLILPYLTAAIFLLSMRPDSKLEIVLNLLVLILAYLQLTTLFILSVFILNFKVFQFGYRKTKYIKTSASSAESIAWAKQEFQDATSYLNTTLECTSDGDAYVTERAIKRAIRSYGIISIMEERIEYVGSNGHSNNTSATTDASFILFDASKEEQLLDNKENNDRDKKPQSTQAHPLVEKSGLGRKTMRGQREVCSEERRPTVEQKRSVRHRSRSPNHRQTNGGGEVPRSQPGKILRQEPYFSNVQPAQTNLAMLIDDSQNSIKQPNQPLQSQIHLMSPITAESPLQRMEQLQGANERSYEPPVVKQQQRQSLPQRNQHYQKHQSRNSYSPQAINRHTRSGSGLQDETRYLSQRVDDLSDNRTGNDATSNNLNLTNDNDLFFDCNGKTGLSDNTSVIMLDVQTTGDFFQPGAGHAGNVGYGDNRSRQHHNDNK